MLTQTRESESLALSIKTKVEYDGYALFECEARARRAVSLDALTLNIPLKTSHATLCVADRVYPRDPKIPMSAFHTGAVRGDMSFLFSGNIWLGNEDVGLCWQAESDEQWHYANQQKAIEILPRGAVTTFRAHLVDTPVRLAAGETLRYTFALQTTPIKPMLRDAWDIRTIRSEPYGADLNLPDRKTPEGELAYDVLKREGVEYLFTNVQEVFPWPVPFHDPFRTALHRLMDTAHAHGLKVYNYQIHQRLPVNVPEFDLYGLSMSMRPLRWYVQGGAPGRNQPRPGPLSVAYGANSQGAVMHCAKSRAVQDAWIHSLAQRLDEFGDDGIYLDGTSQCPPCKNQLHGCGYIGKDGALHSTYPVFAAREFMRRIYAVVKQRRPQGVVDLHTSFGFNPSALAYSDLYWTGEQWGHLRHTGSKHIPDDLTLETFRAGFMGRQFGVPANTLAYRLGPQIKVAAVSLLHDVPVRPNNRDHDVLTHQASDGEYFKKIQLIWKMRDRFAMKDAEKLFYWRNQKYVSVSPERCYTTLFRHPRNGIVAFVTNLNREAQVVTVAFNPDALAIAGRKLEAFDALTGEPAKMSPNGELTLPLEPLQWCYVWVRPQVEKVK